MGINRPALYAAFGSKKELFHRTPPGEDPAALARHVWAARHGLTVLACDGAARADLEDSARRSLRGIFGGA